MVTYKDAPFKFKTGDEMIDQILATTKDKNTYMKISRKGNALAQTRWLENSDNIGKYKELYSLPYASKDRLLLNKQNGL